MDWRLLSMHVTLQNLVLRRKVRMLQQEQRELIRTQTQLYWDRETLHHAVKLSTIMNLRV